MGLSTASTQEVWRAPISLLSKTGLKVLLLPVIVHFTLGNANTLYDRDFNREALINGDVVFGSVRLRALDEDGTILMTGAFWCLMWKGRITNFDVRLRYKRRSWNFLGLLSNSNCVGEE